MSAADNSAMRIAILGFGLIGGSLALAVRRSAPDTELVAWSPSGTGPAAALGDGVLTAVASSPNDALAGADVVVLAAPPLASVALLEDLATHRDSLAPDVTVTDVVSTK